MDRVLAALDDRRHPEHPTVREWALLMYSVLFVSVEEGEAEER